MYGQYMYDAWTLEYFVLEENWYIHIFHLVLPFFYLFAFLSYFWLKEKSIPKARQRFKLMNSNHFRKNVFLIHRNKVKLDLVYGRRMCVCVLLWEFNFSSALKTSISSLHSVSSISPEATICDPIHNSTYHSWTLTEQT